MNKTKLAETRRSLLLRARTRRSEVACDAASKAFGFALVEFIFVSSDGFCLKFIFMLVDYEMCPPCSY